MAGHHATPTHSGAAPGKGISLAAAVSIGVVVALLGAYSYVKLGVRYPSVGGAVQFLVQG